MITDPQFSYLTVSQDEWVNRLATYLSEPRLFHSIRVAQTAYRLATYWNVNPTHAWIAGLLHDIAKEMNPDHLTQLGIKTSTGVSTLFQSYKPIWHAFAAPYLLTDLFHIRSAAILGAVRWHSTGRSAMTPLEKVIYLADYVEPERSFSHRDYMTSLTYDNLDVAMWAVSTSSLLFLLKNRGAIHPKTIDCRNYYAYQVPPHQLEEGRSILWTS